MAKSPVEVNLIPIEATSATFADFGQVIEAPCNDGDMFGPNDAQFQRNPTVTHHANVTQCLGSIGAHVWYLGVAKPSLIEDNDGRKGVDAVKSSSGHLYNPPTVEEVRVFRVSGPKFLKLNRGTWHAGPLFGDSSMDFYNLELSNTNVSGGSSDLNPKRITYPPKTLIKAMQSSYGQFYQGPSSLHPQHLHLAPSLF